MGGKSGGGGSSTVTQKSDPWAGAQPYITQQLSEAQKLYNSGQLAPKFYSGQTVAGQSPETQQAIGLLSQRALNGSPLNNAANQQLQDTISGKYADPSTNPYFQGSLNNIADAYARGTAAQTDAAFNRSGSYGGSAYTETKAANNKAFGDSLNDLANTQYQQNRQQQLQAAALAPTAANQSYNDIAQLANAGQTKDSYQQSVLDDALQRYNYNANLPYNSLSNYASLIGGNYGNTSTQSSSGGGNRLASGLGGGIAGALGGASLFNALPLTLGSLGLGASGASAIGGGLGLLSAISDRRAKTGVKFIGRENGHKMYEFSYKGDKTRARYIGVMAQDIIKTHPEAIFSMGEYMGVDYSKLNVRMRAA